MTKTMTLPTDVGLIVLKSKRTSQADGDDGLELKSHFTLEIKDAEKGQVQAVVATLGVVDRDEDIIRHGAIKSGSKVKVSSYGHSAIFGEAPVGKGALHVEGDEVVFKGQYFMDTMAGREAFNVVKGLDTDGEWSFGFRVLGSEVPDEKEKAKGARRILTKLEAFEVSPVIIGAGIGTGTISAKEKAEADPPPAGAQAPTPTPEEIAAKEKADRETKAAQERAERERRASASEAAEDAHATLRRLKRLGYVP